MFGFFKKKQRVHATPVNIVADPAPSPQKPAPPTPQVPPAPQIPEPDQFEETIQDQGAPAPVQEPEQAIFQEPEREAPQIEEQTEAESVSIDLQPKETPEEICGISEDANETEIRSQLAVLYRRYNRAAAHFDPEKRNEAEKMLEAIVSVRMKLQQSASLSKSDD